MVRGVSSAHAGIVADYRAMEGEIAAIVVQ